jgi:hypothetical protein
LTAMAECIRLFSGTPKTRSGISPILTVPFLF